MAWRVTAALRARYGRVAPSHAPAGRLRAAVTPRSRCGRPEGTPAAPTGLTRQPLWPPARRGRSAGAGMCDPGGPNSWRRPARWAGLGDSPPAGRKGRRITRQYVVMPSGNSAVTVRRRRAGPPSCPSPPTLSAPPSPTAASPLKELCNYRRSWAAYFASASAARRSNVA